MCDRAYTDAAIAELQRIAKKETIMSAEATMNKPEPQARLVIENVNNEFFFRCHVVPEYEEKLKELVEPYCSTIYNNDGYGIFFIIIRRNYNPSQVTEYLLAAINSL
jgi:hypothetical protein